METLGALLVGATRLEDPKGFKEEAPFYKYLSIN